MAYVYRLIVALLLCFGFGANGWASFPATSVQNFTASGICGKTASSSVSAGAACAAAGALYNNVAWGVFDSYYMVGSVCHAKIKNVNDGSSLGECVGPTSVVAGGYSCPVNSTITGSSCSCVAGFAESGGACTAVSAQSICDGMNATGQVYSSGSAASTSTCAGGFVARGSMAAASGGKNYIWGPFTCSGATCTAGAGNTASAEAPSPCVKPKISGTVNGVSVCLTPTSMTAVDKVQAAPTPAGSASAPTSGLGPSAPAGATGSETSTTCSGGNCTTTKNFTDSGGATVGTTSETKPAPAFCSENPASPLCVQSSISQTACGASDSCTGDAVQCAIQARAKQTACAFDNSAALANEEGAYTAAKARTGDQTTGNDVNTNVAISASSFDQTELMGAAVGLSDLSVTVMGRTTVLQMSMLNQWFSVLGYLLVGVTGLLCMRIVSRG